MDTWDLHRAERDCSPTFCTSSLAGVGEEPSGFNSSPGGQALGLPKRKCWGRAIKAPDPVRTSISFEPPAPITQPTNTQMTAMSLEHPIPCPPSHVPQELVQVPVLHVLEDHDERVAVTTHAIKLDDVLVLQVGEQLCLPLEILAGCQGGVFQRLNEGTQTRTGWAQAGQSPNKVVEASQRG